MNRIRLTNAKTAQNHAPSSKNPQKEKFLAYLKDAARVESAGVSYAKGLKSLNYYRLSHILLNIHQAAKKITDLRLKYVE